MAEPLRVAVIGVGSMWANHVRVLRELPDATLAAIAEVDEERRGRAAEGERAYADYRTLLAEERLDAVSIAVPTRLHEQVALACIERGLPLLVEKPLAADLDECLRLRDAARAADVPLMVGQVERFNPAVQELRQRLAAGEAGRVLQVRAKRVGPFFERERDVGVVHDLATHDIDVFRYLLGVEVERVQAETQRGVRTEFEDALAATLRFEDGTVGALEVNWLTPIKVRELTVLGERGMFVLDYLSQTLRFFDAKLGDLGAVQPQVATFPGAGAAPLRAELAAFLRAAQRAEPPAVDAGDAIAAMRVAEALVESANAGEPVRVAAQGTAR